MEVFHLLLLLLTVWAAGGRAAMDECVDELNRPQRCMPEFVNAAFNVTVVATDTCGSPPEEYCVQTGVTGVTKSCHICDSGDPRLHHGAAFLTDYNNQADTTWWQSQTMLAGIQYPHAINLTLHLGKSSVLRSPHKTACVTRVVCMTCNAETSAEIKSINLKLVCSTAVGDNNSIDTFPNSFTCLLKEFGWRALNDPHYSESVGVI